MENGASSFQDLKEEYVWVHPNLTNTRPVMLLAWQPEKCVARQKN